MDLNASYTIGRSSWKTGKNKFSLNELLTIGFRLLLTGMGAVRVPETGKFQNKSLNPDRNPKVQNFQTRPDPQFEFKWISEKFRVSFGFQNSESKKTVPEPEIQNFGVIFLLNIPLTGVNGWTWSVCLIFDAFRTRNKNDSKMKSGFDFKRKFQKSKWLWKWKCRITHYQMAARNGLEDKIAHPIRDPV